MTLLDRAQAVLDGMDSGCSTAEVRADVEALRGELVRRESVPVPPAAVLTPAPRRRWFGMSRG